MFERTNNFVERSTSLVLSTKALKSSIAFDNSKYKKINKKNQNNQAKFGQLLELNQ